MKSVSLAVATAILLTIPTATEKRSVLITSLRTPIIRETEFRMVRVSTFKRFSRSIFGITRRNALLNVRRVLFAGSPSRAITIISRKTQQSACCSVRYNKIQAVDAEVACDLIREYYIYRCGFIVVFSKRAYFAYAPVL